jgi:hypothetical protein
MVVWGMSISFQQLGGKIAGDGRRSSPKTDACEEIARRTRRFDRRIRTWTFSWQTKQPVVAVLQINQLQGISSPAACVNMTTASAA